MKRFTATEKWGKPWHRKLPSKLKTFWDYICANCDAAGVWMVDLELAQFQIGESFTQEEILAAFGERIQPIDNGKKWWLTGFIEFQYGELNAACKPHRPILKLVERHGLTEILKGYRKGIERVSDTLEEKEKDKEKDKEGGTGGDAPTAEQQTESYAGARTLLHYLNSKAGTRFTESASCMDPIADRLFEIQLDVDGCKRMIDRFVVLWKGDPKMEQCLRPHTLFGEKFHGYYGQRDMPVPNGKHAPQDIRVLIAEKDKQIAALKRQHYSETQGLLGGQYLPAGWRCDKAKAECHRLVEEKKDLLRRLENK